ncbi:MAG: peptidase MA family metallohydrolase, partial [Dehalococcoidia bacterium]
MKEALALLALLLLLVPSSVEAQSGTSAGDAQYHLSSLSQNAGNGIVVINTGVEKDFPEQAAFTLEAQSSSDIVDVRLCYRVDKMSHVDVVSEGRAEFVRGTTIEAVWVWDMTNASLPPGAGVTYWWLIEDASGSRLVTSPEIMRFDDNRYMWQSLTSSGFLEECDISEVVEVTILWYQGASSFVQELMNACEEGIMRLTTDIGACPERPIRIYIYASTDDLKGAMIFPQEWTGGVAYTEFSTIAIGIPPSRLSWGKRALVHELTHLVVHQATY